MPDFAVFLNQKMRGRHWTAAELARRTGVSASQISRLLTGERLPSAKQLTRFAAAFHELPDNWLIAGGHPELSPGWREAQPGEPVAMIAEALESGGWSAEVCQAILVLLGALPRRAGAT